MNKEDQKEVESQDVESRKKQMVVSRRSFDDGAAHYSPNKIPSGLATFFFALPMVPSRAQRPLTKGKRGIRLSCRSRSIKGMGVEVRVCVGAVGEEVKTCVEAVVATPS